MDAPNGKSTFQSIRDIILGPMHPTNFDAFKEMLALAVRAGYVHRGLTPEEINPKLKWKNFDCLELRLATPGLGHDFCIICRTNIYHGQRMGFLNCGHCYHYECIRRWLLWLNNCPECQKRALE